MLLITRTYSDTTVQSQRFVMVSVVCTFVWLSTVLQISIGARTGPTTPQPSDFAQCRLSAELKEQFVDFHNKFRGEVQPSAADMEFLVS